MKRICKKLIGTAIMAALLGVNYGPSAGAAEMTHPGMMSSDLRTGFNSLFREHVFLAAWATGAALAGRDGEFKAAAGALDGNSIDIAKAIGSVYGAGAEQAFLPLWRKHIGFVVDYTVGVATKDDAKKNKAVNDLVQYTQDFGAFLSAANPNAPITVKKIDSSVNAVTIDPNSSETIDGAATVALAGQYDAITAVSDGTNWIIV